MPDISFLGYSFIKSLNVSMSHPVFCLLSGLLGDLMSRKAFHYPGESHKCSDGRSLNFSTTQKGRSESSNE